MKLLRAVHCNFHPRCFVGVLLAAILAQPLAVLAQEKKNVRIVFVSLAWNSEIPFRTALARGFFKQQGLQVEPILIRGGPAAIAALVSGEVDFAAIGGVRRFFAVKRAVWTWRSSDALRARPIIFCSETSRRVPWRISKARSLA